MPYIPIKARDRLDRTGAEQPSNTGELAYVISDIIDDYISVDYNFERLSMALGVLEAVKMEVYRRVVAPYEQSKLEANGEVFLLSEMRSE